MGKELLNSDKELLLIDLCARLPYGVKVSVNSEYLSEGLIKTGYDKPLVVYGITADDGVSFTLNKGLMEYSMPILSIKPYLFPLSSMTEEQRDELKSLLRPSVLKSLDEDDEDIEFPTLISANPSVVEIDYYNKKHFDYRGLIPMDLAIDCTGLNIYV